MLMLSMHYMYMYALPSHVIPLSAVVYPASQVQMNVATMLTQFWSHPPLLVSHSFTSVKQNKALTLGMGWKAGSDT